MSSCVQGCAKINLVRIMVNYTHEVILNFQPLNTPLPAAGACSYVCFRVYGPSAIDRYGAFAAFGFLCGALLNYPSKDSQNLTSIFAYIEQG